jgi:general secretion pathway protein C
MTEWALFGSPVDSSPAPAVVVNAPETRLNVRLAGIFHSEGPDSAPLALIAVDSRSQQVFKTDDRLNDGTRISQILTDRVLLERNGQIEALSLPRETVGNGLSHTRSANLNGSASADHTIDATAVAAELRRQVSTNPDALLDLAFATPYFANNQFAGLRLEPGRQPHMFNQLGLRPGDIVVALNGRRLTTPNQGMQLLQELLSAERLEVQVLRNGRHLPLTFILSR